jgi:hypothetical protein
VRIHHDAVGTELNTIKFKDAKRGKDIINAVKHWEQRTLVAWAADCAEQVLPLFEQQVPGDDRPRRAIEAGRAWSRKEISMSEARKAAFAAHAAARDAGNEAATAAARAAGHAAATSHVTGHAIHAATYAAKAAAYSSGAVGPGDAVEAIREWQYQLVLEREGKVST